MPLINLTQQILENMKYLSTA